jgi:hypothetical protein
MATRVVLWIDSSSHVAPKVMNGGASMPSNVEYKPNEAEDPERWFNRGWRIVNATSFAPVQPEHDSGIPAFRAPKEITTLVLEHE